MKKDRRFRWAIKAISRFLTFFLIVSFVITCCTMLFVSVLSESLGIELTGALLETAAKLTFLNVVIISFILTVIDSIRRRIAVNRPVKKILAATEKMMQGDFSVRIPARTKLSADDRFGEIIDCINKMAEELSGLETLRTDFIANVSHEMKTPLAVIHNYGTLLQMPSLSDSKRIEYARALTDASCKLSDMMTNMLKLNRLENQQIYPRSEKYDLGEQLCECLLQHENIWETKGINIETNIEEGVFICTDSELLSLVWNNIFSNAFKFTEAGGTVSLELSADESFAVVKISDTGCGMSGEVGAHIFEKFYQGDTSHSTEGNGLGLALVKRVIDIIKGEIGVESAVGVGTTFTVKIERAKK